MYNDEQNLYHYTYRKDGTEPGQRYDAKQPTVDEQLGSYRQQQEQQTQNSQPVYQSQPQGGQTPHKNGKNRLGLKIASLALVCALLGGLVGGGTAYLVSNSSNSETTEVNVSNRKPTEIQLKTVDGKNPMTDAELYAANVNSVVSINITATSDPNFFGQTTQTAGAGSGFILTPDGYIVTNYHVVGDADTVKVTLYNGDSYDAQLVGADNQSDLALLRMVSLPQEGLVAATFGNSDELEVGEMVVAIGNPGGLALASTQTVGYISAVQRTITTELGYTMVCIQADAAINPGNSGGPLINTYGQVVGITSSKLVEEGYEGIGFSIPINTALPILDDLMQHGRVTGRAQMGITVVEVSSSEAAYYGIPMGLRIMSITEESDMGRQGAEVGDIITSIDGWAVTTRGDVSDILAKHRPGDTVEIGLYRASRTGRGQTLTINVTLIGS